MIFDEHCRLVHNHDHALVELHTLVTSALGPGQGEKQKIQH